MKNVKGLSVLVAGLLCAAFTYDEAWVIDSASNLVIHGKTNINSFSCTVHSYSGHDTLHYFNDTGLDGLRFTQNRMVIPVTQFDCGAKQISRDLQVTLKASTYPYLKISFVSLQRVLTDRAAFNGTVDITLAGVTTRYQIRFSLCTENDITLLTGTHTVKFADFNLTAPEKLNGLIRVKDVLTVEFNLVLKVLS